MLIAVEKHDVAGSLLSQASRLSNVSHFLIVERIRRLHVLLTPLIAQSETT